MRAHEEGATRLLLSVLEWHPVDAEVAEEAGALGRRWLPSHHTIDGADLAIAATAICTGSHLLTRNVRHFPMFPQLCAALLIIDVSLALSELGGDYDDHHLLLPGPLEPEHFGWSLRRAVRRRRERTTRRTRGVGLSVVWGRIEDMTWTAPEPPTYIRPPRVGDERSSLEGWLDAHRQVLRWKCAGLTEEQLKTPANPPSTLTLLGLLRHLAECERWWFQQIAAQGDVPDLYARPDRPDADLDDYADADPAADLAIFDREVADARGAVAGLSLDHVVSHRESGSELNLRWVYLHMIEEYARHNGHADFLREQLDGRTGDFPGRVG